MWSAHEFCLHHQPFDSVTVESSCKEICHWSKCLIKVEKVGSVVCLEWWWWKRVHFRLRRDESEMKSSKKWKSSHVIALLSLSLQIMGWTSVRLFFIFIWHECMSLMRIFLCEDRNCVWNVRGGERGNWKELEIEGVLRHSQSTLYSQIECSWKTNELYCSLNII